MKINEAAEMCGCKCQRIYQMIAEVLIESRKEYGLQLANLDDVMNLAREELKRHRSRTTEFSS